MIDSQLDKEPLRLKYRKVFLKKFLECGNFKVGFECTMCKSVNLRGHVYRTVVQALRHVELVHTMERIRKQKSGGVYNKTLCSYCGEYVLNMKYGSHIESCHPDAMPQLWNHFMWRKLKQSVRSCNVSSGVHSKYIIFLYSGSTFVRISYLMRFFAFLGFSELIRLYRVFNFL